jgi:hypothetical protein
VEWVKYLAAALPALYFIGIIPCILRILLNMETDLYSAENLNLTEKVASRARVSVILYLIGAIFSNAVQLCFATEIQNVNMIAAFPLGQLLIALALCFTAKYVGGAIRLSEENKQFV